MKMELKAGKGTSFAVALLNPPLLLTSLPENPDMIPSLGPEMELAAKESQLREALLSVLS